METSEGIVLKTIPYREYDLLVDLMTGTRGRLMAVARHALKSKKRFGPLLTPPNILNLHFREGPFVFLEEVSLASPLNRLYDNLESLGAAFTFLDSFRTAVHEGNPDPPLYHLLRESLVGLQEGISPAWLLPWFQFKFLSLLGFQPRLEECLRCGRKEEEGQSARGQFAGRYYFLLREGHLVCFRCLPPREPFVILSPAAISLLSKWKGGGPPLPEEEKALGKLPSGRLPLGEVSQFLPQFLEYQLGRRLRSALILGKMAGSVR